MSSKSNVENASSRERCLGVDELVRAILEFLDTPMVGRCLQVSRLFHSVASHSNMWYPRLQRRWGMVLPKGESACEAMRGRARGVFRECLRGEINVRRSRVVYANTRTLMDSRETPLCMHFIGDTLMSGHIDKKVYIWDLKNNRLDRTLGGHSSWIKCLQFDEDVLITGSYDSTIREWDRRNDYSLMREYVGHGENGVTIERSPQGSVVCLKFDDNKIVSGSNDTTIRVWSRSTGECRHVLTGHTRTVRCLDFYDRWCFSGGSDRIVRNHDLETGQSIMTFNPHAHRVSCIKVRLNS